MIGQLWCSLADYYIRGGHFEKVPVRLIWHMYTQTHVQNTHMCIDNVLEP